MAGVFRDAYLFKDYLRLRALFLLVSLLVLFIYLIRHFNLTSAYFPSYFGTPSAADLCGGLIFGIGMVLGGGCLLSTLYKLGAGQTASAITFSGVIIGGFASAALYPMFRSFAASTVLFRNKTALEHIVGSAGAPVLVASLLAALLVARWKKAGKLSQTAYARGYIQLWKASLIMALVIGAVQIFSGRPLAVSMGYAKLSGLLGGMFLPALTGKMAFFHRETPRLLYGRIMDGGAAPVFDSVVLTQLSFMAGVVSGSFISSLRLGEFKIRRLPPKKQAVSAFFGGMFMAAGALMAGGCNLWHLIGGLPVFALQSMVFALGIAGGAFLGSVFIRKAVFR